MLVVAEQWCFLPGVVCTRIASYQLIFAVAEHNRTQFSTEVTLASFEEDLRWRAITHHPELISLASQAGIFSASLALFPA